MTVAITHPPEETREAEIIRRFIEALCRGKPCKIVAHVEAEKG